MWHSLLVKNCNHPRRKMIGRNLWYLKELLSIDGAGAIASASRSSPASQPDTSREPIEFHESLFQPLKLSLCDLRTIWMRHTRRIGMTLTVGPLLHVLHELRCW